VMQHLGANEKAAAQVFPNYGVKPGQFLEII